MVCPTNDDLTPTNLVRSIYQSIHLNAIRIKIRDDNQVLNRAAYIAVGVDLGTCCGCLDGMGDLFG